MTIVAFYFKFATFLSPPPPAGVDTPRAHADGAEWLPGPAEGLLASPKAKMAA